MLSIVIAVICGVFGFRRESLAVPALALLLLAGLYQFAYAPRIGWTAAAVIILLIESFGAYGLGRAVRSLLGDRRK